MMFRSNPARRAFTLLECLVAISIIGVLLAILIPAVQSARGMAKKAQCLNNLRQIGLALSNYAATYDSFPMVNSSGYSFLVTLLPHLDQGPIYHSLNFNGEAWVSAMNATGIQTQLSVYLCPADPPPSWYEAQSGWTGYAGNGGVGIQKYGHNGAFINGPGACVRLREFTDGASATAAVAEWILGSGPRRDRDPLRGTFHTPERLLEPDEFDLFASACRSLDTATARTSLKRKGCEWVRADYGMSLYNHTLTPNDHTCLNGSAYQQGAWTAGSRHPGGTNVLFADSSARNVRRTVDLAVWRALGSRNGGETISQDSL